MTQANVIQAFKTVKERSNMKKARIAAHLSQKQAAKGCGVIERTYLNWEKGYTTPYTCELDDLRDTIKFTGTDEELLEVFIVEVPVEKQVLVEEPQDTLEAMDGLPQDTQGLEEEPLTLDEQKRRTLEIAIRAAGLGFIPGTALLTGPIIGPDIYLPQCSIAIDECWEHLKHGDFYKVERTLNAHMPTLMQYANTEAGYQKFAAGLAVRAKMLQVILATHKLDYATREKLCVDAVHFGGLTSDRRLHAQALMYQAYTYIICPLPRPDKAIPIFLDALSLVNGSAALLQQCDIYVCLANAYALDGNETETLTALKQGERAFFGHPDFRQDLDWLYGQGFPEFHIMKGKAFLNLAPRFPKGDYFQKAYTIFTSNKGQITARRIAQLAILQADAARGLGEMKHFIDCLTSGLDIAIKINSQKRMSEIHDVISRVPERWQGESRIKTLIDDINGAQAKLITPPTTA
jgi:transcriptional regulator with XRE-family HTH domain